MARTKPKPVTRRKPAAKPVARRRPRPLEVPTLHTEEPQAATMNYEEEDLKQRLIEWWEQRAHDEVMEVAPKAIEYGAADLKIMGQAMLHLMPQRNGVAQMDGRDATIQDGMEMAVAFYALGKVARLFGAYEKGRRPGRDSWHDLAVYTRMNIFIAEFGRWP